MYVDSGEQLPGTVVLNIKLKLLMRRNEQDDRLIACKATPVSLSPLGSGPRPYIYTLT